MAVGRLGDLAAGLRFVHSLASAPGRPVSLDEARRALRDRLARREADFLALIDTAIYANATSPYRRLLALAGCERGDIDALVRRDGIEGALATLYRHGVYLTVDEMKGRRPAVRGGESVRVEPALLRVPGSAAHVITHSSGSRGPRTAVTLDLAALRAQAGNVALLFEARGGADWVHAVWAVPGSAVVGRLHHYQTLRLRVDRWFSHVDARSPGLHPRYRWSARLQRLGSRLAGFPLPAPEHVSVDDPLPIARWMQGVLRRGRRPHLWTFPSSAVRLCQAAERAGLALRGAQFTLTGEPMTDGRRRTIVGAGADAQACYGSAETGMVGYGCLEPDASDDVHVASDLHAVIQAGPDGPLRPRALLVTSLGTSARVMLLNVSLGDEADLGVRACGCPLESSGWRSHLRHIRSFEKLNAGGIALLDADVVGVLEETLPARFGGGPTDYQLVEDESPDGGARLRLLVHPAIGPLDERAVADAFLAAIGQGEGVERLVELHWRQAGLPVVERQAPRMGASGKIAHLERPRAGGAAD
jgi:hypothetical protein